MQSDQTERHNVEQLLTIEQLADLTHAPVATVRWWRTNGEGPQGFRVGKRVLYRESAVEAWLASREQASA